MRLLKPIVLALFMLCPWLLDGQVSVPQLNLSGNIGCIGFPCVNTGTYVLASDANVTLPITSTATSAFYLKVTSSVSLTATRTITYPVGRFPVGIENATTGGQALIVCGTSGNCVNIPNSTTSYTPVWNDGTNFVQAAGTLGGTGTSGSIPLWSGISTLGNSPLSVSNSPTTAGVFDSGTFYGGDVCWHYESGNNPLTACLRYAGHGTYYGPYNTADGVNFTPTPFSVGQLQIGTPGATGATGQDQAPQIIFYEGDTGATGPIQPGMATIAMYQSQPTGSCPNSTAPGAVPVWGFAPDKTVSFCTNSASSTWSLYSSGGSGTVNAGTAHTLTQYTATGTVVGQSNITTDDNTLVVPGLITPQNGIADFVNSGTGAPGCAAWRGVINVKDCGAKGNSTNPDTSAIQAAINIASCTGNNVYIPATGNNNYYSVTTLYLYYDASLNPNFCSPVSTGGVGQGFTIYGDGSGTINHPKPTTTNIQGSSTTLPIFNMQYGVTYSGSGSFPYQYQGIKLRDLNIVGATSAPVLNWTGNFGSDITNVTVWQNGSGIGASLRSVFNNSTYKNIQVNSTNTAPALINATAWSCNGTNCIVTAPNTFVAGQYVYIGPLNTNAIPSAPDCIGSTLSPVISSGLSTSQFEVIETDTTCSGSVMGTVFPYLTGSVGLLVSAENAVTGGSINIQSNSVQGGFAIGTMIGPNMYEVNADVLDGEQADIGIVLNRVDSTHLSSFHGERNSYLDVDITGNSRGIFMGGGTANSCCGNSGGVQIEGSPSNINTGITIAGSSFWNISTGSAVAYGINIINSNYSGGVISGNTFTPSAFFLTPVGAAIHTNSNPLWLPNTVYTFQSADLLIGGSYYIYNVNAVCTSGATQPTATSGTVTDGTCTWTVVGLNGAHFSGRNWSAFGNSSRTVVPQAAGLPLWTALTLYSTGAQVRLLISGTYYEYTASAGGTSSATQPTATIGTVTDGTVTWAVDGSIPATISLAQFVDNSSNFDFWVDPATHASVFSNINTPTLNSLGGAMIFGQANNNNLFTTLQPLGIGTGSFSCGNGTTSICLTYAGSSSAPGIDMEFGPSETHPLHIAAQYLHGFFGIFDSSIVVNGSTPLTAVQGTDSAIMTAGTVTASQPIACTDVNGGTTTVGCGAYASLPGNNSLTGVNIFSNTVNIASISDSSSNSTLNILNHAQSASIASIDGLGNAKFASIISPNLTGAPTANGSPLCTSATGCSPIAPVVSSPVNCSVSGTVVFAQTVINSNDNEVIGNFQSCNGTFSYTYPTAYSSTPAVLLAGSLTSGSTITSTSTAITGAMATATGFAVVKGW